MAETNKIYQLTDDEMNPIYPLTDVHGLVDDGQPFDFDTMMNGASFDLTEYMSGATYSGITVALSAMNSNVPSEYKRGGMMLKYIDSADNKYVHWFNTYSAWTTTVTYWQGVDEEPTAGSDNLVKSGGVKEELNLLCQEVHKKFYKWPGMMSSTGDYVAQAGTAYVVIPVLEGSRIKIIKPDDNYNRYFAFLATFNGTPSSSFDVIGTRQLLSATVETTIPTGANYLYILVKYNNNDWPLPKIEVDGITVNLPVDRELMQARAKVVEVEPAKHGIVNAVLKYTTGYIDKDGVLVKTTGTSWYASDYVSIGIGNKVYAYLAGAGGIVSCVAFYDRHKTFISRLNASSDYTPQLFDTFAPNKAAYVRFSCYNSSNSIDNCYAYVLNFNQIDLDEGLRRIMRKYDLNILNGYINTSGNYVAATGTDWWSTDFIPAYEYCFINYRVRGQANATLLIAFYDSNKTYISGSGVAPTDSNWKEDYIQAPEGTAYIRCCTQSAGATSLDNVKYAYVYVQTFPYEVVPSPEPVIDFYGELKYKGNVHPETYTSKSIMFFGDSITYGVASLAPDTEHPYGLENITNCYAKLLSDYLGSSSFSNKAISGSSFVDGGNQIKTITTKILETTDSADVIYIAGGTNDFQLQTPIGTIADTTATSLYGALHVICEYLKTNYASAIVIFATPINWSKSISSVDKKLNDYRNAIFEVATMYGYMVVDCSDIGFPKELSSAGTPAYKAALCYDGIHPTKLGHSVMAGNIAKMLI